MRKLLACLCALVALSACMDDDVFTASPTARITIWRDTISLDTILAGEATPTDTFKIYNRTSKGIRLQRVWLEGGASSPFRVNVDGDFLAGGEGGGFELRPHDSLLVFYFLSAPDFDADEPCHTADRLHFLTEGGVEQSVVLSAWTQSVIPLHSVHFDADARLDAHRPYQVFDTLKVAEGATLTLGAGVRLLFHPGASLVVDGTLKAEGEPGREVTLRGDRLGNMLSNLPYDRVPNQWGGVVFSASSYGNELHYANVHSGAFGLRCDSADVTRDKLLLDGCVVHNVAGDGLYLRHCRVKAVNCQLTNAAGNCVTVLGGDVAFVHCTIAQFYPFVGGSGVALSFANFDGAARLPLLGLQLQNSIVTGRNADDVMGAQNADFPDDAFAYRFNACLLNTPRVADDDAFSACRWEADNPRGFSTADNFEPAFDYSALTFCFKLSERSQALGGADADVTSAFAPLDREGVSRPQGEGPDMGCYERRAE